jgi:hypothetical protein
MTKYMFFVQIIFFLSWPPPDPIKNELITIRLKKKQINNTLEIVHLNNIERSIINCLK